MFFLQNCWCQDLTSFILDINNGKIDSMVKPVNGLQCSQKDESPKHFIRQCLKSLCHAQNRESVLKKYDLLNSEFFNTVNLDLIESAIGEYEKEYKDNVEQFNKVREEQLLAVFREFKRRVDVKKIDRNIIQNFAQQLLDNNLSIRSTDRGPGVEHRIIDHGKSNLISDSIQKDYLDLFISLNIDLNKILSSTPLNEIPKKISNYLESRETIDPISKKNIIEIGKNITMKNVSESKMAAAKILKEFALKKMIQDERLVDNIKKAILGLAEEEVKEKTRNFFKGRRSYIIKNLIVKKLNESCDSEKFKSLINFVKKKFKENVISKFSEETSERLIDDLERNLPIEVNIDLPVVDDISSFKNIKLAPFPAGAIEKQTSEKLSRWFLLKNVFLFENIEESYYDSLVSDYFNTSVGVLDLNKFLVVSSYSCTNDKMGMGILSHELGHYLSSFMSSSLKSESSYKKYLSLRRCVEETHSKRRKKKLDMSLSKYDIPAPLSHHGDLTITEESVADFVSFNTIDDGKELFTCSLIDNTDYEINLILDKFNPAGDYNPSIYRILLEAVYKGVELSEDCEKVIKQFPQIKSIKECKI